MKRWTEESHNQLRDLWAAGTGKSDIRRIMGLTPGQLSGQITRLNLHGRPRQRAHVSAGKPGIVEGRTIYPSTVRRVSEISAANGLKALKPGGWSRKLGSVITKGPWAGFPIYSLTLEERKTCPRTCSHWRDCYGNSMQWARRVRHGAELEARLLNELRTLNHRSRYTGGFAVRLHVLGDFYSVEYVDCWRRWLDWFPRLHIFGYTAHDPASEIGRLLLLLRRHERCDIRFSGIDTVVIDRVEDAPSGSIVCPAQTGRTRSCSTCALCWSSTSKVISFLAH